MLSDEVIERLNERLVNRIEELNTEIISEIAKTIKDMEDMTPTQIQNLVQIFRYGGSYKKIAEKLAEITNLNVKDIYDIFEAVAKKNQYFAKQFYDYRGIDFIPYKENKVLQNEVKAIADITANTYKNISRSRALGYSLKDDNGNVIFKTITETYKDVVDKALLSVSQGKSTYASEMGKIMKEISQSGIKCIDLESGRSIRLDSYTRMIMQSSLRDMSIRLQQEFGEKFDADGVEISVHINPAPDHALVQGHQFYNEEFDKFQNDKDCKDVKGIVYSKEYDGRDRRSIGEYNCYHYIFSIIVGVNEPLYSNDELQNILDKNKKGFEFEGKHYTNYEGTQLQRKLETEIRKNKDLQIMAKKSNKQELLMEAQENINVLTDKYNDLCKKSGLLPKKQRLSVSGYRKVKINTVKKEKLDKKPINKKIKNNDNNFNYEEMFMLYSGDLSDKNVDVRSSVMNLDEEMQIRTLEQVNNIIDKYPVLADSYKKRGLVIETSSTKRAIADMSYNGNTLRLSTTYYKEKEKLINVAKKNINSGWNMKVPEDKGDIYIVTHEMGHAIEDRFCYEYCKRHNHSLLEYREIMDTEIYNEIFKKAKNETGLTITEIKNKYLSRYGKSKRHYEWFAEIFAQYELGEETPLTKAMGEWLERNMK